MRKLKKLFHYEGEMINSKELEDDLRLAEVFIEKIKRKLDPRLERKYRRQQIRDNIYDLIVWCLLFILFAFSFAAGCDFERQVKLSDYISEAAYTVSEE